MAKRRTRRAKPKWRFPASMPEDFAKDIVRQCRYSCKKGRRNKPGSFKGRTFNACFNRCVKYLEIHSFIPYWRRTTRRR